MPYRVLSFLAATLALGCSSDPQGPPDPAASRYADRAAVDLSHAYDENTVFWPTGKPFKHVQTAWGTTPQGYFYSSFDFAVSEHSGTHLDAPLHFAEGAAAADELPLERLIGPAVVIDVAAASKGDPDYALTAADIAGAEAVEGLIPSGAIVLIRSGWSARWPDRKAYLGDDRPGRTDDLHFPGLSPEAAEALAARGVDAVGIDTASIDPGPSLDFRAHRVLAAAGVPALENLTNLDRLPPRGAEIIALPMKIAGGSGAPCRVVAVLPPRVEPR